MHRRPSPAELIRRGSPLIVRSRLAARDAVAQMAEDFRQLVVTAGGVVNEDLLVIGWTQQQINAHGSRARTRALEHSVRA